MRAAESWPRAFRPESSGTMGRGPDRWRPCPKSLARLGRRGNPLITQGPSSAGGDCYNMGNADRRDRLRPARLPHGRDRGGANARSIRRAPRVGPAARVLAPAQDRAGSRFLHGPPGQDGRGDLHGLRLLRLRALHLARLPGLPVGASRRDLHGLRLLGRGRSERLGLGLLRHLLELGLPALRQRSFRGDVQFLGLFGWRRAQFLGRLVMRDLLELGVSALRVGLLGRDVQFLGPLGRRRAEFLGSLRVRHLLLLRLSEMRLRLFRGNLQFLRLL